MFVVWLNVNVPVPPPLHDTIARSTVTRCAESDSVPAGDVPMPLTSTLPAASVDGVIVTAAPASLGTIAIASTTSKRLAYILPQPIVQRYAAPMQTTASGLQYEDTVVGTGPQPKAGQTC